MDAPRFMMLETLREFRLDQLLHHDELDTVGARHMAYFVALVEEAVPALQSAGQASWLDQLEADLNNFRAAFAWAMAHGHVAVAAREAVALGAFWWHRGRVVEVRSWLEQLVAQPQPIPPRLRCLVLLHAARVAGIQHDRPATESRLAEALTLARSIAEPDLLREVLLARA